LAALKKIVVQAYKGYASNRQLICYGRVVLDAPTHHAYSNSKWRNFIETFKRLESDEIPNFEFEYIWQGRTNAIVTNSEGFFKIQETSAISFTIKDLQAFELVVHPNHLGDEYCIDKNKIQPEIFMAHEAVQYGVISDIDDTILQTGVLSKWQLMVNSIFTHINDRKIVPHTNTWYQQLHKGVNPFFYISNSPWNFYHKLHTFLQLHQYPNGPILLRDFGRKKKDALQDMKQHKHNEIVSILKTYPNLSFILIGDGGERDADIYLHIKQLFPTQIKAIYIHRLGDAAHQRRIENLAKGHEAYFYFIGGAKERMGSDEE
jgi:phosphatidate phosphatase APP1